MPMTARKGFGFQAATLAYIQRAIANAEYMKRSYKNSGGRMNLNLRQGKKTKNYGKRMLGFID